MRSSLLALASAVLCTFTGTVYGQFLSPPQYDTSVRLSYVRLGDVNNDGKADALGIQGAEITVLPGTGKGGFGTPITTTITGIDNVDPGQFLLNDFNGDGRPDVVVFGNDHVTGQAVLAVMLGNGDGTFMAPRETVTGPIPPPPSGSAFTAIGGDFNGDGKLDIAYLTGSTLKVVFGKGDGTFFAAVTTILSSPARSIAAGDFNNDKKLDLVMVDGSSSIGTFLLLGNGNGTFEAATRIALYELFPTIPADLNGDGNLDLVLGGPSGRGTTILLGDGTGHFPTRHFYNTAAGQSTVVVRDLNGDGRPDIALLVNTGHPSFITILLNNGDGSFTIGKSYDADGKAVGMIAATLNGDQHVDLAFGNLNGGLSVLIGNGNGTFKGNPALPVTSSGGLTVGAFNSDAKPDLVLTGSGQVLLGNGDGTFSVNNTNCPFFPITVGDFNRDGKEDFAGEVKLNGVPSISVCLRTGNGTFTLGGNFDQGIQHGVLLAGDFNNDGKLDLAAADQHGFSILLGNGDGTFQSGIPTSTSGTFPTLALGDFNNDGNLDVAVLTDSASGVEVFLGKGNGTFANPIIMPNAPSFGLVTVADLNKDGKLDLVISNSAGLAIMLGKGDGSFQPATHYGTVAVTQAVVADFNGDSNPDVAVGGGGGVVSLFLGNGTGKLMTPPKTFVVGGVADLATADFNGDHKQDLAVLVLGGLVVTLLHQ